MFQEIGGSWLACPTGSTHPTGSAGPCRTWSLTRRCQVIGLWWCKLAQIPNSLCWKISKPTLQVFVSNSAVNDNKPFGKGARLSLVIEDRARRSKFEACKSEIKLLKAPRLMDENGSSSFDPWIFGAFNFQHLEKTCVSPCNLKKKRSMYGFFSPLS